MSNCTDLSMNLFRHPEIQRIAFSFFGRQRRTADHARKYSRAARISRIAKRLSAALIRSSSSIIGGAKLGNSSNPDYRIALVILYVAKMSDHSTRKWQFRYAAPFSAHSPRNSGNYLLQT